MLGIWCRWESASGSVVKPLACWRICFASFGMGVVSCYPIFERIFERC